MKILCRFLVVWKDLKTPDDRGKCWFLGGNSWGDLKGFPLEVCIEDYVYSCSCIVDVCVWVFLAYINSVWILFGTCTFCCYLCLVVMRYLVVEWTARVFFLFTLWESKIPTPDPPTTCETTVLYLAHQSLPFKSTLQLQAVLHRQPKTIATLF